MKNTILVITSLGLLFVGCALPEQTTTNKTNQEEPLKEEMQEKTKLDLSNKSLEKIPEDVFNQFDLKELDVSNNKLTGSIQSEIRDLENLEVLIASNNQMTGVPAEIGHLRNLQILDLSDNKLTGLPNELGNLQNLKTFDISGNDFSELDLNAIQEKLPDDVNIIK